MEYYQRELMQSDPITESCEKDLEENQILKGKYKRARAEFDRRMFDKIKSLNEKSQAQIDSEKDFLVHRYSSDEGSLKYDLSSYLKLLQETNSQLKSGNYVR